MYVIILNVLLLLFYSSSLYLCVFISVIACPTTCTLHISEVCPHEDKAWEHIYKFFTSTNATETTKTFFRSLLSR